MAPLGISWKKGFARVRATHVSAPAHFLAFLSNVNFASRLQECEHCELLLYSRSLGKYAYSSSAYIEDTRINIPPNYRAIGRLIPFSLITTSDPRTVSRFHPKSNHRASPVNPSRQFLSDCMSIRSISQPKFGDSFVARRAKSTRKSFKSIPLLGIFR